MPLFEFRCPTCDHRFEELVSGDAVPPCPSCQAIVTERLISACRIQGACARGGYSPDSAAGTASGKCGGCSGGNCASCH